MGLPKENVLEELRLLIVDDDVDLAKCLEKCLRSHFAGVHVEHSARGAIEALRNADAEGNRFGALIVDLILEDGSGEDILQASRKLPGWIATVAISGAPDCTRRSIDLRRACTVLHKPAEIPEILYALRNHRSVHDEYASLHALSLVEAHLTRHLHLSEKDFMAIHPCVRGTYRQYLGRVQGKTGKDGRGKILEDVANLADYPPLRPSGEYRKATAPPQRLQTRRTRKG